MVPASQTKVVDIGKKAALQHPDRIKYIPPRSISFDAPQTVYNRSNQVILTPFMINVACNLLNQNITSNPESWNQQQLNIEAYINN